MCDNFPVTRRSLNTRPSNERSFYRHNAVGTRHGTAGVFAQLSLSCCSVLLGVRFGLTSLPYDFSRGYT